MSDTDVQNIIINMKTFNGGENMNKVLLVEDDQEINKMEQALLGKYDYQVTAAYSGTEALLLVEREEFDIILLDLMLPGISGEEVLEQIRKIDNVPIMCISAKDNMSDKLDVIRAGADDYITKPFNNEELLVRMEALLRRSKKNSQNEGNNVITFKDIILDLDNHTATVLGNSIELTQKEYGILELLISNPKKVFTKDNIYESVWNEEYIPEDNTVNVHISNLRSKLNEYSKGINYIKTVWGIGFKLNDE